MSQQMTDLEFQAWQREMVMRPDKSTEYTKEQLEALLEKQEEFIESLIPYEIWRLMAPRTQEECDFVEWLHSSSLQLRESLKTRLRMKSVH